MKLFTELKRRNVFRVGAAYALFAWIVIEVSSTVVPILKLPEWTLALILWMVVAAFPFVLVFAWAFELTPEGLKREKDVDRSESITSQTGQRINYIVIGLLVVAVAFLVADNYIFTEEDGETVSTALESPAPGAGGTAYDSIGVLPFVNMSDDPSQEYFSDGIAEELLNSLAKLRELQVAARTSSFAFKGLNQDITEIGKSLNVDTVLEGSVRKAGNRLRITAQLIDVSDGYHIWSETYDRELTDVFAIQDEITESIVSALLPHFEVGGSDGATKHAVTDMSAYDAYLQGRHLASQPSDDAIREALQLFRQATETDPDFAAAWAARAQAVLSLRQTAFRDGIPSEEAFLLARTAIDRALAIDPELAEAYVSEGFLYSDMYRYEEALASLEKAVEINPNLAEGWVGMSRLLGRFGRVAESREAILMALRLDPHNEMTAILAANLLQDFYDAGYAAKIERFVAQSPRAKFIVEATRMSVERPNLDLYQRALAMLTQEDPRSIARLNFGALKELDEATFRGGGPVGESFVMWLYIHSGQWDRAQAIYDGLPEKGQQSVLNLEELSIMRAAQGRCGEAIELLDQAHGGRVRIHGEVAPTYNRSNSNLALNRVFCLRQLGRTQEAEPILERLREYVGTLRENTTYGMYVVDAKLSVLDGDTDGAIDILEAAFERNELGWTDRNDPVLKTLVGEPGFDELFESVDARVDSLRAELGMPPASI